MATDRQELTLSSSLGKRTIARRPQIKPPSPLPSFFRDCFPPLYTPALLTARELPRPHPPLPGRSQRARRSRGMAPPLPSSSSDDLESQLVGEDSDDFLTTGSALTIDDILEVSGASPGQRGRRAEGGRGGRGAVGQRGAEGRAGGGGVRERGERQRGGGTGGVTPGWRCPSGERKSGRGWGGRGARAGGAEWENRRDAAIVAGSAELSRCG